MVVISCSLSSSRITAADVLNYRGVYCECDKAVVLYAKEQLLLGQELPREEFELNNPRCVEASLVGLLVVSGEDVGKILAASTGGVRS